jgi:hypothetical protein
MDKKKLEELMSKRFTSDTPERVAIEPADLYGTKPNGTPNGRANDRTHNRTNDRTDKRTDNRTVIEEASILTELKEGIKEATRKTERYSFEIYKDQKDKLEELQYKYKKKTDKKISASSIIREALDIYLEKAKKSL